MRNPETQEIPRAQWGEFLDSFSRKHRGWLLFVETVGASRGSAVDGHELPLIRVEADSRRTQPRWILVILGASPASALTHIIPSPMRLKLHSTISGEDKSLEVDSKDGTNTLLRFRRTALPELLDGISQAELVQG